MSAAREVLVEDRHTTPADLAAFRLDFGAWLDAFSPRDRQLAEVLATSESTGRVARMFAVTAGRVSQLRRKLCDSWLAFIGDAPTKKTGLAHVFA